MKIKYIFPIVLLLVGCGSKEAKVESTSTEVVESNYVNLTAAQLKNAEIKTGTIRYYDDNCCGSLDKRSYTIEWLPSSTILP